MLFITRTHLASVMADLARDGRLEPQRRPRDFFPLRKRIPRETKKSRLRRPPLALRQGVRRRSSPAFAIAIEAAAVAGSKTANKEK
jgi:hypothetical protein